MIRDFKYIIKRIIIGVGIALVLGLLKGTLIANVYASTSRYTLYSENYTNLWSNTVTTNQTINVQNVSRIRINFNDAIAQDSTYQITLKIDLTASDYVPYYNPSGIFVGGTGQTSETSTVSSTITPQGSSSFLREAVITYTFKANNTSSDNFWEGQLNHVSRVTYLNATISVTKISDNTGEQIANSTQNIINNNNNNTESIINNNNNNTNQIINNQNSNTDKEIESQKVCKHFTINKSSIVLPNNYLNLSTGQPSPSSAGSGVTDYFDLNNSSSIKFLSDDNPAIGFCYYDSNKNYIGCRVAQNYNTSSSVPILTGSAYVRFTILEPTNKPIIDLYTCKNGNQALNDSINATNDTINNDNVDESSQKAKDFFDNFNVGDTGNLTDIISLPLDFLDSLNNQCSPITLSLPKMGNITIPCIQSYVSQFIPNELINLIKLGINGYFIYKILSSLIDFINTLKDPNNDDLEVMDL